MTLDATATVLALKQRIEKETGVPAILQKIVFKSAKLADDKATLRGMKLVNNTKLLLIGSKVHLRFAALPQLICALFLQPDEVQAACSKPTAEQIKEDDDIASSMCCME